MLVTRPLVSLAAAQHLDKIKKRSERQSLGLPPKQGILGSLTSWICYKSSEWCLQLFCPCCVQTRRERLSNLLHYRRCRIFGSNKYLYELFTSLVAFVAGWMLAFMASLIAIYVFGYDPWYMMLYGGILGVFLSFSLWFQVLFRCYIIVFIINICSEKFTWAVMIYAIYVTSNGPVENIKLNSQVMINDLVCMVEIVFNNSRLFGDRAANPLNEVIKSMHESMDRMEQYSTLMKEGVNNMLKTIRFFQSVLKQIVRLCKKLKGLCSYFCDYMCQKCSTVLLLPYQSCMRKLPSIFVSLCTPLRIPGVMCGPFCVGRYILCYGPSVFVVMVKWWMNIAINVIGTFSSFASLADFRIQVTWSVSYQTIQSKSYLNVAAQIFTEAFYSVFHFIEFCLSLSMYFFIFIGVFMCLDVLWYVYQYYFFDKFDNDVVNETVMFIDMRRKARRRPTILPLRRTELKFYGISGQKLSEKEKRGMMLMLMRVSLVVVLTLVIFLIDYCMYRAVQSYHENMVHVRIISFALSVEVEGEGILVELYRDLIKSFVEVKSDKNVLADCTTKPHEFDMKSFLGIVLVYGFVYASILLKPLLHRLRLWVCDMFFPNRKLQRSIWLYNNILRKRIPLLKMDFDRVAHSESRKIRRTSLLEKLAARFNLIDDVLNCLGYERLYCLMCGINGHPHDPSFYKCSNYGCTGLYCEACFNETNKICALCHRLITFDDEDVSEEMDSSDEEVLEERRQLVKLSNMLNSGEPGQQNPQWSYMNQRNNFNSYNVASDWRVRSFKRTGRKRHSSVEAHV